ncbi:hypothetical protein CVU37_04615 [candidate division BRC1 bacterium HGW-BRC1-1]|nr:MAG: hypothetical protein CVU37_04615 [candidate division BRC1 bacterium HGW-BRC1-1]
MITASKPFTRLRTRGVTLTEMIVALSIFAMAGIAMASTMVIYARAAKSLTTRTRMEESARRFVQTLEFEAAEAQSVGVLNSGTMLQFIRPDNSVRQYVFANGDGNLNTIGDNQILERVTADTNTGARVRLSLCSQVTSGGATLPVFQQDDTADRTFANLIVRVGDRNTSRNAAVRKTDDLETGPGYQAFVINVSFVPGAI